MLLKRFEFLSSWFLEALLFALIKRHRHDARAYQSSSNVDFNFATFTCEFDRNIGHADVSLQIRCWTSRSDIANALALNQHVLPVASDAAVSDFESNQLALDAF